MAGEIFNVDELVDGQKFRKFNLNLMIWSWLAMFADGFETASLGIVAPNIIREWHSSPAELGPVMSASLVGVLVGAPLFGWLGDRFGRRVAVIVGTLLFSLTTLAVVGASGIGQLALLRFLAGIGMGGIMPNTISLNTELAPRRLRAMLVILMFTGITLGGTVPGVVAVTLIPTYGWKVLFLVGGVFPLLITAGLYFALPESVKFLVMRAERTKELIHTLRKMRQDVSIPDDAQFVRPVVSRSEQNSIRPLFQNGLAPTTLLLWFCVSVTLMANYFMNSWLLVILEEKGVSHSAGALTASLYHAGASLGGIGMSLVLDRWGFRIIALVLGLAAPVLLLVALPGLPVMVLALLVACAGFCVLGAQAGFNASSGIIYPTAFRAKGVGMAFAAGRVGSIAGPIVGGMLLKMQLPLIWLLSAIAGPVLLGAGATVLLYRVSRQHMRDGGDPVAPADNGLAVAQPV
jgi:AAHS family 4-hydroxybenzoate transporter-like MFS transporter